jgi:hypothetical protein
MTYLADAPDGASKPTKKGKDDTDTLKVMRSRLSTGIDALSKSRNDELEDLKFAAGSSDNNWQWPDAVLTSRTLADGGGVRPTLTINKLPQHIKQVTNDQRQNRPAGKVIPANGDASVEVSEVFEGMVRHIESKSDADVVYDTACENQVTFGEGFWRIITDYVDEDSFDQDILLQRIMNSFSVIMDPMIQKPSGEDAEWCFIYEDITKEEYGEQYPNATPISTIEVNTVGASPWISDKTIRIAEYFYYESTPDTLNLYANGETAFESEKKNALLKKAYGEPIKSRPSDRKRVKWCKTNGYEMLDSRDWLGKYIPVVRVVGNEFEVDGERFVTGIVRNAKDAQRMYNYWTSQEAEMLALAPKAPFIGYGGQFEGYEHKWKTANTNNWPYLEVNPDVTDANGGALPLPARSQPPMAQNGLIAAKQGAAEDIKATTGQYNASLGMTSNERSGKAIMARQHEGDVGTFHYGDNLARAVRYSTRQLVDLIPKIYDTARVARIIGEDRATKMVKINPDQPTPVAEEKDPQGNVIGKIYNPSVGRYDVEVVTGPGYATKRREALDGMAEILQSNPQLWALAGDLFVKNMDWPGAQELAKRLAKGIDPKLMQDDDNPALQQAKQQIQQLMEELNHANQMLQNIQHSMEVQEIQIKQGELKVKMYDAETKRIQATQAGMNPDQIQDIVLGTIHAAVHTGDLVATIPQAPQPEVPQQPELPQQPMEQPPQVPQPTPGVQ